MTNDSLMPLDGSRITDQNVTIDTAHPLTLSITNSSGDIDVTTGDRHDIHVVAERTDSGKQDDEARIVIDVEDNRVSIHPNWQIGNTIGEIARKVKHQLKEGFNSDEWDLKNMKLGGNAHFDIRVELPRQLAEASSVSIKTATGDISVADIPARVSTATANGDIQLDRLTGKVTSHSASGDISVRNINGSIEANSANGDIHVDGGEAWTALRAVNGDIEVDNLVMKNARVTTVSGDIDLHATLNNTASYTFDTVSGDVTLETSLPTTGASLNFRAVSGDADVSGDWSAATGKRNWQLAGGNEGPAIRVKAVSGDLRAEAVARPTVTVTNDTAPQGQDNLDDDSGDMTGATSNVDWHKAKDWVSKMTRSMSQVVNEMDEAGEHRQASGKSDAPTEPVPPVTPAPPKPASVTDTEPVTPPSPAWANTAAFKPSEPAGTSTDDTETSAQRRSRLLEAVQRGEMTVDEALSKLDGEDAGASTD